MSINLGAEHASPHCACGINDAGQRFVDPICQPDGGVVVDPIVTALKAERKRRRETLEALGQRMGRQTYNTVWQWESGTNEPRLSNLRAWAAALGYELTLQMAEPNATTSEAP
jgi:hypothetical protein